MTESRDQDSENRLILTAEQAERILAPSESIHSYVQAGPILLGCDYSRQTALEQLRTASQLEIGGPGCRSMGHGLAVWTGPQKVVFLEHDAEQLEQLEAELTGASEVPAQADQPPGAAG